MRIGHYNAMRLILNCALYFHRMYIFMNTKLVTGITDQIKRPGVCIVVKAANFMYCMYYIGHNYLVSIANMFIDIDL